MQRREVVYMSTSAPKPHPGRIAHSMARHNAVGERESVCEDGRQSRLLVLVIGTWNTRLADLTDMSLLTPTLDG
jgi:hypothetical protein